jgi:hypothetical protein
MYCAGENNATDGKGQRTGVLGLVPGAPVGCGRRRGYNYKVSGQTLGKARVMS